MARKPTKAERRLRLIAKIVPLAEHATTPPGIRQNAEARLKHLKATPEDIAWVKAWAKLDAIRDGRTAARAKPQPAPAKERAAPAKKRKRSKPLTAKRVERTTTPGRYRDRIVPGLLLQISESGAKSWVLRYALHGKERMMGLGSASVFSLKQARDRARSARQLLADGIDPLATKRATLAAAKAAAAKRLTFREAAELYYNQHAPEWGNKVHREQFLGSLKSYAYAHIGTTDVAAVDTPDVLRVLNPIWLIKTTTASRVRNRLERILDWAVVSGHRPRGDNPARWRGHLEEMLPKPSKVAPKVHHAALPYADVPSFLIDLRAHEDVAARALEFTILTAARTGEVLGAKWSEIDLDNAMWVIPASRMKMRREHRVPLSAAAIDLLNKLPREEASPFVFIGPQQGLGLGGMALSRLLHRMGYSETVHGFRSSFSDWAHEETSHANHTIELALAHQVGSETELSYRRKDMVAKRVKLMADWSRFCTTKPISKVKVAGGNVVALPRGRQ
jgi:integrase